MPLQNLAVPSSRLQLLTQGRLLVLLDQVGSLLLAELLEGFLTTLVEEIIGKRLAADRDGLVL